VLNSVHAEAIDIGFANPVAVGVDQGVDNGVPRCVIIIGVIAQRRHIAVLVFRVRVVIVHVAATMVQRFVAEFGGYRTIGAVEIAEGKLLVGIKVVFDFVFVVPVRAGVVDNDVEDNPHGRRPGVGGSHEIDEVLLGADLGIDVEIVIDVVPVIGAGIVFKDWGEPNGGTTQAGDVIKILGNTADPAAVEIVGSGNTVGAA